MLRNMGNFEMSITCYDSNLWLMSQVWIIGSLSATIYAQPRTANEDYHYHAGTLSCSQWMIKRSPI